MDEQLKIYYVSLCRGLIGYYVKFVAPSEDAVRNHVSRYFGRMWCSVYTEAYFYEVLRKKYPRNSKVINRDDPVILEDEEGLWE